MNIKFYRIISLIILFTFLTIGASPHVALADNIIKVNGYEFDTSTGEILKYTGKENYLTIPNEIDGVTVKIIKEMAFYMWQGKKLTIPSSILEIEENAFCACGCLQEICVDENNPNYSSEDGVLFNKDKTVLIKYGNNKSDVSYTIPDGIKKIKIGAFEYCLEIINIAIPDTLKLTCSIGNMPNLVEIIVNKTNPYNTVIEGVLFDKDLKTIIQYPKAKQGKKFVIPESVTTIAKDALSIVSDLEEIQIPDSVTKINDYAFACCHLTSIDIPQGVTVLEKGVLSNTGVSTINIPNNITNIKEKVFWSCWNIDNITIPNSVKSIGAECFAMCDSLQKISLPDTITTIEDGMFMYCQSLKDIVLPKNIVSIGDKAFLACRSLEEISIPDGVQSIGKESFAYCDKLKKIVIPESVTSIDATAFKNSRPTIYGKTGSYAESFAKKNNIKFMDESLEKATPTIATSPTTAPKETSTNTTKSSNNLIYIEIGIVLLIIFGLGLLIRRKKDKKE